MGAKRKAWTSFDMWIVRGRKQVSREGIHWGDQRDVWTFRQKYLVGVWVTREAFGEGVSPHNTDSGVTNVNLTTTEKNKIAVLLESRGRRNA